MNIDINKLRKSESWLIIILQFSFMFNSIENSELFAFFFHIISMKTFFIYLSVFAFLLKMDGYIFNFIIESLALYQQGKLNMNVANN